MHGVSADVMVSLLTDGRVIYSQISLDRNRLFPSIDSDIFFAEALF